MSTEKDRFEKQYTECDIVRVPFLISVPSRKMREMLIDAVRQASRIADFGCGHGSGIWAMTQYNSESKIVGYDYSETAIRKVRDFFSDMANISAYEMDFYEETVDEQYDFIFSSQVIEHIDDDEMFLRKIHDSLTENGRAFISTVYKKPWARYFYKNSRGQNVLEPTHVREYITVDDLLQKISSANLRVVDYDLTLIKFPLIDIPLKILSKVVKNKAVFSIMNSKVIAFFRKYFVIPIIGFYNFQIVVTKENSNL